MLNWEKNTSFGHRGHQVGENFVKMGCIRELLLCHHYFWKRSMEGELNHDVQLHHPVKTNYWNFPKPFYLRAIGTHACTQVSFDASSYQYPSGATEPVMCKR